MFLPVLILCLALGMGCGRVDKSSETLNAEFAGQFPEPLDGGARKDK